MLRSVFAIALIGACHPAPAPTVAHAAPTARAPSPPSPPVRQDFEVLDAMRPGPLHEVIATGHECKQERPSPIEWTGQPLQITVAPAPGCAPLVHDIPRTPSDIAHGLADR